MRQRLKGMTLLEFIVSLIIILFFAGILLGFIHKASIHARQTALRYELDNMRLLINLHRELNGAYPKDLKIFLKMPYSFGTSDKIIFGEKFIDTIGLDKEGYPVDPFGSRLFYDTQSGAVRSITKNYENW